MVLKKKKYFNVLMVVIVIYCIRCIILLCNALKMLNVKIKNFDIGCIIKCGVKIDKIVF